MTTATAATADTPTAAEARAARDRRLWEARQTGEKWARIAASEGVTEKTAIQGARRHERAVAEAGVVLPDVLPEAREIVAEVIASELVALRAAVAMIGKADNASAAVGVLRTVASLGAGLHMTLIRSGLVRSPGMEWFGAELQMAVRAMYKLAEQHDLPEDAVLLALDDVPRRGIPLLEVIPRG